MSDFLRKLIRFSSKSVVCEERPSEAKQLTAGGEEESRTIYSSYASRVTKRLSACSCGRVRIHGFPFANQVQHSFLLRDSQHLQLEFAARDRVADPLTWTRRRP